MKNGKEGNKDIRKNKNAQSRFSKHISGFISVFDNVYLGDKYYIFSYNKARPASESDNLVNNKKVFSNFF